MSFNVTKGTFGHVRVAKIHTSLRIRTVWSESSRGTFWIAKDAMFLHESDNESCDPSVVVEQTLTLTNYRTSMDKFTRGIHYFSYFCSKT